MIATGLPLPCPAPLCSPRLSKIDPLSFFRGGAGGKRNAQSEDGIVEGNSRTCAGARAFQGDARAGNAPAHDQHVERRPFAQSRETLFPAQDARSAGRLPAPSGSKCSIIAAGVRMPR